MGWSLSEDVERWLILSREECVRCPLPSLFSSCSSIFEVAEQFVVRRRMPYLVDDAPRFGQGSIEDPRLRSNFVNLV